MALNILIEASGSLVSGYMIDAIQRAGHRAIASDIDAQAVGRHLADDFIQVPSATDPDLWPRLESLLIEHRIDMVIPSIDETLLGWATRKRALAHTGITICLSDEAVIQTFSDKWLSYQFFRAHDIPTPNSSLEQLYPMIKPRFGRGGRGVGIASNPIEMTGLLSQEVVQGTEYTVDVLCAPSGAPIYIVPRRRIGVRDGKSTGGVVECRADIMHIVRRLCESAHFIGPINVQCFVQFDGTVTVIEVNPRIAGGMALGFAATENWIPLLCRMFRNGEVPAPREVRDGLRMHRYYAEIFVPAD